MEAKIILRSIDALTDARKALRAGGYSIAEQMRIGDACCDAAIQLRSALIAECPEIQISLPAEVA